MKHFITIIISIFAVFHLQITPTLAATDATPTGVDYVEGDNQYVDYSEDDAQIAIMFFILLIMGIFAAPLAIACTKLDTSLHALFGATLVGMEIAFWSAYTKGATIETKITEGSMEEYHTQAQAMASAASLTWKAKTWMDVRFGLFVGLTVGILLTMVYVIVKTTLIIVGTLGAKAATAGKCWGKAGKPDIEEDVRFQTPIPDEFKEFRPGNAPDTLFSKLKLPFSFSELHKRFLPSKTLSDSVFAMDETLGLQSGEVHSPTLDNYQLLKKNEDFSFLGDKDDDLMQFLKSGLKNLANFGIPEAKADYTLKDLITKLSAMGIAVTTTIASIAAGVKGLFKVAKVHGFARSAVYGVEGTLLGVMSGLTKQTSDKLGERAQAYDKLYEKLQRLITDQPGYTPGLDHQIQNPQVTRTQNEAQAIDSLNGTCFTSGSQGEMNTNSSCSCMETNTCKKSTVPSLSYPNFTPPKVLTETAAMGAQMANDVFSGNMGGAYVQANSMGKNATKIRKLNQKLQNIANKKMIKYGKKPYDFAGKQKKLKNNLMKGINRSMSGMSSQERSELISAILGKANPGGVLGKEREKAPVIPTTAPKVAIAAPKKVDQKKKPKFDFLDEDKETEKDESGLQKGEDTKEKDLSEFEDSSKQISKRTKVSIFKIIKMRYFKSAYPKFFEEQK